MVLGKLDNRAKTEVNIFCANIVLLGTNGVIFYSGKNINISESSNVGYSFEAFKLLTAVVT